MKTSFKRVLVPLLLVLPAVVQSQFTFTSNSGTITITRYTGPGGAVTIPDATNGWPVTCIGGYFNDASWEGAFQNTILTSVTIPNSLTAIGSYAFGYCTNLASVYFQGNTPDLGGTNVFSYAANATLYYLPGTTGWSTNFAGRPTALWLPKMQISDASFGVGTNHCRFTITWASGMTVVVEACTNLANPTWIPLATNTLSGGSAYFSDPQWTNYPARFYRVRSP